ncbi:MAG TPA: class I SAM-dependent methyltransferase [Bacteroidota bacterium]|nr:class I SAM-dependent methyltransferase [Bacteroidota bacterium]
MLCRVCDSTDLDLAIDLGKQPWANNFLREDQIGKELYYPLRVVYCQRCSAAQLDTTVPKEVMFGDHTYLSGMTKSLSEHFKAIAQEVDGRFFSTLKQKTALDIGSNDGTQLKHYQALGYDAVGVESSRTIARIANDAGVPTVNEFFNLDLVKKLGRKFEVINASGVFFHLEELHSVCEGIREALSENGVFLVQFLYMKRIVENLAFDQIYHEHLLYYNLKTIQTLLQRHGLEMFDAYVSPIHGGSVIGCITHTGKRQPSERLEILRGEEDRAKSNDLQTYREFAKRIEESKGENLRYLTSAKGGSKRIFGFGAPVKGNTLLNHFGIGTDLLDCLVEKNELRRGLFSPGMHIPIAIEKELPAPPDIYYVLAWNFKKEILANNRALIDRGIEFYFPVNPKDS